MESMKLLSILFLLCTALSIGCKEESNEPVVCTQVFVMYTVTVLDAIGSPVDSVKIKVTGSSGYIYELDDEIILGFPGTYVIMSDKYQQKLSGRIEDVSVIGTKGTLTFKENYIFSADECHIFKISGKDTVTIK